MKSPDRFVAGDHCIASLVARPGTNDAIVRIYLGSLLVATPMLLKIGIQS
jgi:hypothetical protein